MTWLPLALAMVVSGVAVYALAGSVPYHAIPHTRSERVERLRQGLDCLSHTSAVQAVIALPSVQRVARALFSRLAAHGHAVPFAYCRTFVALSPVIAGCAGGIWASSLAVVPVMMAVMWFALHALASSFARREARALAQEMPAVFRMLASALGSGKTLAQAVEYVGAHARGRVGEEFARVALELRFGEPARLALEGLAQRLDAPGVRMLVTALAISQQTGSSLDAMLSRSARMVEAQEELARTLGVKTAQARLSIKIVCLMPVVMLSLLSLLSVDFQRGLSTPVGMGCVACALGMDGVALLVVRRMMRGVV